MKLFGYVIERATKRADLSPVGGRGWYRILESFTGAWQRNVTLSRDCQLASSAVYAAVSMISGDIAKLPLGLKRRESGDTWQWTEDSPFWPVLRRPIRVN